METKTYYASTKWKGFALLLSVIGLLLVVGGIVSLIASGKPIPITDGLAPSIAIVLFGAMGVVSAKQYFQAVRRLKPSLIIDADGVEISTAGLPTMRVAWSDIETTYLVKQYRLPFYFLRYLCFTVRDPDSVVPAATNRTQKFLIKENMSLLGTPFWVSEIALNEPIENVQLVIENHLYERRKAQEIITAERLPDVSDAAPQRLAAL